MDTAPKVAVFGRAAKTQHDVPNHIFWFEPIIYDSHRCAAFLFSFALVRAGRAARTPSIHKQGVATTDCSLSTKKAVARLLDTPVRYREFKTRCARGRNRSGFARFFGRKVEILVCPRRVMTGWERVSAIKDRPSRARFARSIVYGMVWSRVTGHALWKKSVF